jgi:hypothetical protein
VPKDPKRNIQNYQLRGGHLDEYAFQKNQGQMVQESELPFTDETDRLKLTQATKRVAEVIAEAHGIVEKRKQDGLVTTGGRRNIAVGKRSAKKVATKSTKKAGTKKRASATAKRSAKKVATKSAKKITARAGTRTRPSMKTRRQKRASNR